MHSKFNLSLSEHVARSEIEPMLIRLIDNLSGVVYRRKHDVAWTMEFVSRAWRDLTGYDPHRFIGNASVAFADLIAPEDRGRVFAAIDAAVNGGRRGTITYRVRAAHGGMIAVEDRFCPVRAVSGKTVVIEGVIDRASPRRRRYHGGRLLCRWTLSADRISASTGQSERSKHHTHEEA